MSSSRITHPLNVSYLVVGLVFLGIAGSWVLRQAGLIDLSDIRWLLPATLVAAGLTGVVALAAKGLAYDDDAHTYDYDDYYEYEGDAR